MGPNRSGESEAIARLSLDVALDSLADECRRRLLVALSERDSLDGVDAWVPANATDEDGDSKALESAMHHVHLPKLDGTGLIEWDRDGDAVRKGTRFEEIEPVLELLRDHADDLPARADGRPDEWF